LTAARRFHVIFALPLLVLALAAPALAARAPEPVRGDSTGMDWSLVPEYRLVPGDLLRFNFGPRLDGATDFFREGRVRPDGRVSVYPVGDVVAAGRTPRELEGVLIDLLAVELRQPRVTIEVAEMAGNQVHILGRVKSPGSYPVSPFMTVTQAISVAGGFEDDAEGNSVMVFHRDGARTLRVTRIPLDQAIKRGTLAADVPLARFDIVYVPRSTIGNIDVFARQFFGEPSQILNFGIMGWELFNLEKVFVVGGSSN
jgi:polysaccharide biosynthesis/export protein PslD